MHGMGDSIPYSSSHYTAYNACTHVCVRVQHKKSVRRRRKVLNFTAEAKKGIELHTPQCAVSVFAPLRKTS